MHCGCMNATFLSTYCACLAIVHISVSTMDSGGWKVDLFRCFSFFPPFSVWGREFVFWYGGQGTSTLCGTFVYTSYFYILIVERLVFTF